jgi:O-antigen/teichoic acid export membrane protein
VLGYAVAAAVQAGVALLSVPMLTRLLGPHQFGVWTLFEPVMVLLAQVALLGVNFGLLRLVGEGDWSPRDAWSALFGPALAVTAGMATLSAASLAWLWPATGGALALGLLVVGEAVTLMGLAALRANNRSWAFSAVLVLKSVLWMALLLAAWRWQFPPLPQAATALGWLLMPTWAAALMTLLLLEPWAGATRQGAAADAAARRGLAATVAARPPVLSVYTAAAAYGAPLMGSGLLNTLLAVGDRYVMAIWLDVAQIGAYVVIVKLASAVNLLAMPLNLWFPAARFAYLKDADGGQRFFRRLSWSVAVLSFSLAGLLWLLAPTLIHWFNPVQQPDRWVAGWLLGGAACMALVGVMNVGLLASGRTQLVLVCTLVAGVLHLGLLVVLVPRHGVAGAAVATAVGGGATLSLQFWLSQRCHPIEHATRWIMLHGAGVVLLCALLTRMSTGHSLSGVLVFCAATAALTWLGWHGQRRGMRSR